MGETIFVGNIRSSFAPFWLLWQFMFGSKPSVMGDDPEHDDSDFDETD